MRLDLRYDDAAARAALRKAPEIVARRLDQGIERGVQEVAREGRERAPKAFSTLTNSIRAQRQGVLHWFVAPGVNYAGNVEGGRRPGKMPGIGNGLLEWIKLKVAPGASDKEIDRLGYVIARAIGRRGIDPQPYMQPAWDAKQARVVELADAGVRQAVAEINGGAHAA